MDGKKFRTILACGQGGILDAKAREAGLCVHYLNNLIRPVNPVFDILAFFEIMAFLRREKPDIIHTHSSKAGIIARLAARCAGVPVIIHTFHGFGFHDRQPPAVRKIYILAEQLCAKISHALIFVSNANMQTALALKIGKQSSYRLIRSGITLEQYPAKSAEGTRIRAELGLPEKGPIVTSIGNLKPQKNPEDFIAAAEIVLKECPEACFLFIGDGILRPEAEKLVRLKGLEKKCFFPGWRRDIPEILSISSVFALTSLWEGLPRSAVEALKTGLPCVCYKTDGVADIIKDGVNGFLTQQKDPAEMARHICSILKDENLRNRLARGAAETKLDEFDIDLMVRRQENLYEELLRRR